jgi:transcriptional regulator
MDTNSPTAPRRALAAERRKRAVSLRIQGATYDEIGLVLGISHQNAHAHVKKALEIIRTETAESTEELRQIEIKRCESYLKLIGEQIGKGDLLAIDRALRISKRLSEITGIDAPVKHDVDEKRDVTILVKYEDKHNE